MARILSISYDSSLLATRERLLAARSHTVTSANGVRQAVEHCCSDTPFDLLIMGHSIPAREKEALIEHFRTRRPAASVIALERDGEERVRGADASIEPLPAMLLDAVSRLSGTKGTAA